MGSKSSDVVGQVADYAYRSLRWGQHRVPPVIRSLIGCLLMIGGVFGFLPILGFWMFPVGMAFVALDVPPARRHIDSWMAKLHRRAYPDASTSSQ